MTTSIQSGSETRRPLGLSLQQFGTAAFLGGTFWITAEVLELAFQGHTTVSLLFTIAAFLLIALGVLGIHQGQREATGRVSAISAIVTSLGYLLFVLPSAAILSSAYTDDAALMASGSPIGAALMVGILAAVLGGIVLFVTVLRAGIFPRGLAGLHIFALIAVFAIGAAEGPEILGKLANALTAATVAGFGILLWKRGKPISQTV